MDKSCDIKQEDEPPDIRINTRWPQVRKKYKNISPRKKIIQTNKPQLFVRAKKNNEFVTYHSNLAGKYMELGFFSTFANV